MKRLEEERVRRESVKMSSEAAGEETEHKIKPELSAFAIKFLSDSQFFICYHYCYCHIF